MIPVRLVDSSGHILDIASISVEGKEIPILVVTTPQKAHGVFKSASWTGVQAATILVEPDGDGSIELTDLVISSPRKNTGTILVQFIDDNANVEVILETSVTGDPVNLAIPFSGRFQGWSGARIEYTIGTASDGGSILVGYIKHRKEGSMKYGDWNARR